MVPSAWPERYRVAVDRACGLGVCGGCEAGRDGTESDGKVTLHAHPGEAREPVGTRSG